MATNGISVSPPAALDTQPWWDEIRAQCMHLSVEERADPSWVPNGNNDWWANFFQAWYDTDMAITDGLISRFNTWNREGRLHLWGVPGRTLLDIIDSIHNGAPLG
jgi:hypothetical protein